MSSFTPEHVAHFRQVFNQFSNEDAGGVPRENFITAVETSIEHCDFAGPPPSHSYLDGEFQRITGGSGVIEWQQFFQVAMKTGSLWLHTSPPYHLAG